ncbi:hypothetical protein [Paraburkholderia sp. BR14263]
MSVSQQGNWFGVGLEQNVAHFAMLVFNSANDWIAAQERDSFLAIRDD